MRIAYVGNFSRPWCTEVHVSSALQELGATVVKLQENRTQLEASAKTLLRTSNPPDLFLWTRTWEVNRAQAEGMFDVCAQAGVPIVSFHLDRYNGLEREPLIDSEPFFRTDCLFTPDDGDWAAHGVRHHWMPPGVHGPEAKVRYLPNPKRWPFDVAFVGSYPYPHPDWAPVRAAALRALADRYGQRFGLLPQGGRPIRGADLGELYATVPVLVGDSCWPGLDAPARGRYWSDRVPETLGRGGWLIHPHSDPLAELYPDLATYELGDHDALIRLVDWGLAEPEKRQAAAERSRELVLERDTYTARMAELIKAARELPPREVRSSAPPPRATPRTVPSPRARRGTDDDGLTWGHYRAKRLRFGFKTAEGVTDAHAVKEVWGNDDYLAAKLGLAGSIVIDIGANVGAFSILAAMLGARQVHAYEPHPETFAVLEENVARCPAGAKITCHNAAVGGWATTDLLVGDGGGAHLSPSGVGDGHEVAVLDIDSVLFELADTVVKIDCEGGEYAIIEAVAPAALYQVKTLVMEYHGPAMPHLGHIDVHGRWGPMVYRLAQHGRVTTVGNPDVGGLLWCERHKRGRKGPM